VTALEQGERVSFGGISIAGSEMTIFGELLVELAGEQFTRRLGLGEVSDVHLLYW
jgi:hypothetical protein